MALLDQGASQKLHQMDGHHRNMACAEDGNAALPSGLKQGEFLSEGVHPVKGWEVEGPGHKPRHTSDLPTVATV